MPASTDHLDRTHALLEDHSPTAEKFAPEITQALVTQLSDDSRLCLARQLLDNPQNLIRPRVLRQSRPVLLRPTCFGPTQQHQPRPRARSPMHCLASRNANGALRGRLSMHLKQGLTADTIAAIGEPLPIAIPQSSQTPYDIDREIQQSLVAMCADLDSFTEVEAISLMLSGYQATDDRMRHQQQRQQEQLIPGQWGAFDLAAAPEEWNFKQLPHRWPATGKLWPTAQAFRAAIGSGRADLFQGLSVAAGGKGGDMVGVGRGCWVARYGWLIAVGIRGLPH